MTSRARTKPELGGGAAQATIAPLNEAQLAEGLWDRTDVARFLKVSPRSVYELPGLPRITLRITVHHRPAMTTRERLHRLIDVLPEAVLADVERVLVALVLGTRATAEQRAALEAELAA